MACCKTGWWCWWVWGQLEKALIRLCWLLPGSGLGSSCRASQTTRSSWKLHALNTAQNWEFPCVTGGVHFTGGAWSLPQVTEVVQASSSLQAWLQHVLQTRQNLPCRAGHTAWLGSQKVGGLWGAHGSAGVTPAVPMWSNTTQSWWNWICRSILPDTVHKHHQELWLWDKPSFLCWFKAFLVENCHVFSVTNSSPNSKLLLLSWVTSTKTKDWERFSFFTKWEKEMHSRRTWIPLMSQNREEVLCFSVP